MSNSPGFKNTCNCENSLISVADIRRTRCLGCSCEGCSRPAAASISARALRVLRWKL
ncbi:MULTISPECIES: DNA repair protein RecO C-terminal domain-containing protein [unclassified Pseudomonas]|uniref:DNA repair protein RecO C-terminal domain-containing protein n=1 Tax=unclassified Pseudomonas TaxID=196821 RepID=UPI003531F28B